MDTENIIVLSAKDLETKLVSILINSVTHTT